MVASFLTSKGQTTIPQVIRQHLGLEPGDKIAYVIDEQGMVHLEACTIDVASLKGILAKPKKAVSLDEMERIIRSKRSSL
jgi:bifunctional DNA-binding transcriptional regulator/antitoxin component of YhaV-PrlF toxin-antitoxin module